MEQNQLRLMAGLCVLGLALGALSLYWKAEEEPADPDATEAVWRIDPDALERVEIRRLSDTVILQKEGEGWVITQPWTGVADPDVMHDLLDDLGEVERGVPLDLSGADPAEFGLADPPTALVRVTDAEGVVSEVRIGDEAPVGYRTYALSEAGEIVAVGGRPTRTLLAEASTFKDRRVFHFAPEDVRRVTIESADGTLSVHGEKNTWWLDGFTRAVPDRVDDLVMGLLDVRVDQFLDLSDHISEPEIVVTVAQTAGPPVVVAVGEPTPMGVLVEFDGQFGVVFPESLRLLVQGPTDIGDRQAFPVDNERVERVKITRGEAVWEAFRNGSSWSVDGVDHPEAQDTIDAVADALIHYQREPVAPFDTPWATVEIQSVDRTIVVDLGPVEGDDFRVAKDRAGGSPYLVPIADLASINKF